MIDRKEYQRKYYYERYYDRKARGLCVDCGKQPAMKGYVRCWQCEIKNCKKAKRTYHKRVDLLEGAISEVTE